MSPRDLVYVGHMLDMARKAVGKVQGLPRDGFDADENLRLALIHLVQVIGEAPVMEAHSSGLRSVGEEPDAANDYVDVRIATGMGIARNVIIVRSAAAVIAIAGGPGTLSEIAHCLQLGVPVISLGSFDVSSAIVQVDTALEAVDAAVAAAEDS